MIWMTDLSFPSTVVLITVENTLRTEKLNYIIISYTQKQLNHKKSNLESWEMIEFFFSAFL